MKKTIELHLKNREVYQLFERKIKGNRLLIDMVLHKLNQIACQYPSQLTNGIDNHHKIEHTLLKATQEFMDEIQRFEQVLRKKREHDDLTNTIVLSFKSQITLNNTLDVKLIDFIRSYDTLVTILKCLQLTGCFATYESFFINTKRIQKSVNLVLSTIVLTPKTCKA